MSKFILTILISLTAQAVTPVEKYFESRNQYLDKFAKKTPKPKEANAALKDLEKQLNAIVAMPTRGKINLETLVPDGGFGQADGLNYTKSDLEHQFVTTKAVLEKYLTEHPRLPKEIEKLAESELFYSLVFSWDTGFSRFAELPMRNGRAFLVLRAQDIGPFVPETVIVWAERGEKIYLAMLEVAGETKPIAKCQGVWDEVQKQKAAQADKYKAAQLEEKSYKDFRECYGTSVKDEAYYKNLLSRAQTVLDGLRN